jgi:hypothetical protein
MGTRPRRIGAAILREVRGAGGEAIIAWVRK